LVVELTPCTFQVNFDTAPEPTVFALPAGWAMTAYALPSLAEVRVVRITLSVTCPAVVEVPVCKVRLAGVVRRRRPYCNPRIGLG